jgi:peptide deformylase
VLKRRGKPIPELTGEQIETQLMPRIETMFRIMQEEGGIGLAAPQVGWSVRLFITRIPVGESGGDQRVYINPEIISASGEEEGEEGCLSFPDLRGRIRRHTELYLRARAADGTVFEEHGYGLTARCWEHELDHLDGILFISRMSAGDRLAIKQGLRELEEKYEKRSGKRGRRNVHS